MVSNAAAERFQDAPWLADLDAASRLALLNVLHEGRAGPGAVLLAEGQPNDRITFLIAGTVAVTRSYPGRPDEAIVTLAAPTVFGETSFFGPNPPLVTVRARTAAWFLTLDRHAYALLRRADLRAAEQFARAAVRVLAERFDLLDRRASDFLAQQQADNHPTRAREWTAFRARLFEESSL